MDEIIWSSEALQSIASAFREASDEIEAKISFLRRCRNDVPLALKDDDGTLLDDILEQIEYAIRNLTDVSEWALELARAVQITNTLFEETEQDVWRLYEDIAVSANAYSVASFEPNPWETSANVAIAKGMAERWVTVPDWLTSAAEQFFQGT